MSDIYEKITKLYTKEIIMVINLIDINFQMVESWKKEFQFISNINIHNKSIFEIQADAIVSPANSFGIMDGGLDGKIRDFFGIKIEHTLRKNIFKIILCAKQIYCRMIWKKNFILIKTA